MGLNLAGLATVFYGDLIMKYFYGDSLPAYSRRAVTSFWRKSVHNTG